MSQYRKVVTLNVTVETDFEDFESISIIDAGESAGFQVKGEDYKGFTSAWVQIPTGIPFNAGKTDVTGISKLSVKATSGQDLNVSVIIIY